MSRRSLPKIDSALDLSGRLLSWDDLPEPWDAARLFQRTAPLEIEIGSGKGLFLSAAATARPEHDFLGVEIAQKYARFIAARLAKRAIPNARILSGDALRLFRERLPDGSVAAAHVYFPDPWWKKRHRKRRVMNGAFIADLARTLVPGGELHFWTDVEEYFTESLALIALEPRFTGPLAVPESPAEHDLDYRTHFERRMRMHGQAVYRSLFVKRAV